MLAAANVICVILIWGKPLFAEPPMLMSIGGSANKGTLICPPSQHNLKKTRVVFSVAQNKAPQ